MDLMDNFNLLHILVWLSTAEFAIQVAISGLSEKVKELTALNQRERLSGLSKVSFWKKLFGKRWWVLSPLLLIFVLLFSIYNFFSEMVDCPFCTCWWLAVAVNHFYLNYGVFESFLFAPLALVFVAILDLIHSR